MATRERQLFAAEAKKFKLSIEDEAILMVERNKEKLPVRYLDKVVEFVASACDRKAEDDMQTTIRFNGRYVFLSR